MGDAIPGIHGDLAQAVAVTVSRKPESPSPGGNLPSNRYLTHCSYSLQHRMVDIIVARFCEKASFF